VNDRAAVSPTRSSPIAVRGRRGAPAPVRFGLLAGLAAGLLAGVPASGRAQVTGSVDAGATRVAYGDVSAASALVLSPAVLVNGPSASLAADGSLSRFDGGEWSAQWRATGSGFVPLVLGLQAELGGTLAGADAEGTPASGGASGVTRLHWLRRAGGVWAGAGIGRTTDGFAWRTTRTAEAGGWVRLGPATLALTATPTWIGDSLSYLDGEVGARVVRGRVDATLYGGWRRWSELREAPGSTWGGVTAAFWLTGHVAVVLGAGSYPADVAQGFPSGSYLSLGLRLATARPPEPERDALRVRLPETGAAAPEFEVRPDRPGFRRIRTRAPGASRVELMADFTDWRVIELRPDGDRWAAVVPLGPGVYRVNLRIDGGAWTAPPGLPLLSDEFGGTVGILVVP